ncbi:MAG: bifunctional riboflavin kinase/FAD synthetase [Sedimentisphaerales bacterium]|nr:bifunctional riboflavin kinase/FAD synthetase [Sedimentisphaerales bacterium]
MKVLTRRADFEQVRKGCVLTIGNFDGVHVGHQEILCTARRQAEDLDTEMAVMTFEPHPVAALHPEKAPGVLTPLPLKLHLLKGYADHCIIVLEGNRELLELSPQAFVDELLMATIRPSVIVEGDDFNFGARRAGDVHTLRGLGKDRGFRVVVVPPKQIELATNQKVRVSSTIIRYMIESGHVGEAAEALSRPYRLLGPVIRGRGRGRKLGFPTLNMEKPQQILPADGVYAGCVEIADDEERLLQEPHYLPAVFSIGQARTFGDQHPLLIEAHVLTGNIGDMTGKWMAMSFVQRLRSQHKFGTPHELVAQIEKDCEAAQQVLRTCRCA